MELERKAVLITGASKGLGRALAEELARAGARLVLVARGAEALEEVAAGIRARGGEAYAIPADVGEVGRAPAIVAQAAALLGGVDVLVHDASTLGPLPMPLLADTADQDLQRVFEVNVLGPSALTRAAVGAMAMRGEGVVVGISSDAAVGGYPRWGAYGASKAALDLLIRTWAAELGVTGVRFLAVDPGEMDTDMHRDAMPDAERASLPAPSAVAPKIVEMIARAPNGARIVASEWS